MKQFLEQLQKQFKNLDPRDPSRWPAVPQGLLLLGVFIGIQVGAYFVEWQSQFEALDEGRQEEVKLKEEYVNKKRQAVNLDLYREQLRAIDNSFGALLRQLPSKSQMEALLVDINQAGIGRGLQFELFRPAGQETIREFYAELPITIKLSGRYHEIGAFAADIGQLSRIVTLNNIALTAGKDGALVMDSTARTFRYLDDEELSAQRRAGKAGKSGKAGK